MQMVLSSSSGGRFVEYLKTCEGQKVFSQEEKEEFLMSILLHDIGKLVTPLERMGTTSMERVL